MTASEREVRRQLRKFYPWLPEHRRYVAVGSDDSADGSQLGSILVRADVRPALFPYQEDLVADALSVLNEGRTALLSLPTGGGKTRTAAVALLHSLTSARRIVWMAPTLELLDQAAETIRAMWSELPLVPDLELHRGLPAQNSRRATVWLTTPHAVAALGREIERFGHCHSVIFDEAHQVEAPMFKSSVQCLLGAGTSVLGLSATPGRASARETVSLTQFFEGNLLTSDRLGRNPVKTLQKEGVLAHLRFRDLTRHYIPPADEAQRLQIAARACRALAHRGRRTLVFAASVAGAHALAEILNHQGVPAAAVDSTLEVAERRARLNAFARGRLVVLTNQRILSTGYDCPAVSDCLLLAPVHSPILFEQMVGRAARGPRTGGWSKASIWQFDSHLDIHGLPTSYYRFQEWE